MNKICEQCGDEHDGSYGSGRFCSKLCRDKYSGAARKGQSRKRKEPWHCDQCDQVFETRAKLYQHKHQIHKIKRVWNKGLTKTSDKRVAKCVNTLKKHLTDGTVTHSMKGKHLSEKTKRAISNSMKLAHKEGRAHNIGESRWNNEPSYPEQWFMKVIENEFNDRKYKREMPFHRFSLDFAWVEKKRCIEIDGDQHQRFDEYKQRDERKDELLQKEGWKILRLIWKDVYSDPKFWILKAKEFIDS